jgi:protein-disulfide isomerase
MILNNEEVNESNSENKKIITLFIIFLVLELVIIGIGVLPSYDLRWAAAQQTDNSSDTKLSLSVLRQQDVPLLGTPAPVTIIEFGDFQCPFCDRFAKETEAQINQTYIQTGKVNMMFVHFTIYGHDSITSAMAAQCATN